MLANRRIRASQLNKSDGGVEFIKLIDDLLAHDAGRSEFLRALLRKLGLKVSLENDLWFEEPKNQYNHIFEFFV